MYQKYLLATYSIHTAGRAGGPDTDLVVTFACPAQPVVCILADEARRYNFNQSPWDPLWNRVFAAHRVVQQPAVGIPSPGSPQVPPDNGVAHEMLFVAELLDAAVIP
ncbi:hypothetical protein [Mycobacterium asiaticum]|uniref:hypothetical protein n=1 Tax=Mycobacterium asiaticum TaxID=1790 RepID=UPI000B0F688E|nr:hypothetical protein [Mycobacterium asiaticum]